MKCPVCGLPTSREIFYNATTLEEIYEECPSGHWEVVYAYGNYLEQIGDEEFGWPSSATTEDIERERRRIQDAITQLKSNMSVSSVH